MYYFSDKKQAEDAWDSDKAELLPQPENSLTALRGEVTQENNPVRSPECLWTVLGVTLRSTVPNLGSRVCHGARGSLSGRQQARVPGLPSARSPVTRRGAAPPTTAAAKGSAPPQRKKERFPPRRGSACPAACERTSGPATDAAAAGSDALPPAPGRPRPRPRGGAGAALAAAGTPPAGRCRGAAVAPPCWAPRPLSSARRDGPGPRARPAAAPRRRSSPRRRRPRAPLAPAPQRRRPRSGGGGWPRWRRPRRPRRERSRSSGASSRSARGAATWC